VEERLLLARRQISEPFQEGDAQVATQRSDVGPGPLSQCRIERGERAKQSAECSIKLAEPNSSARRRRRAHLLDHRADKG
jgi:hypothetical protein